MTTTTLSHRAAKRTRGSYGFSTLAQMVWHKLRTVRSTWYILAVFAAAMIGLAMLVMSLENYAQMSSADRASFDPTKDVFLLGLLLGQLLLGVLTITTELSSGMRHVRRGAQAFARARCQGSGPRSRHTGGGRDLRLRRVLRRPGNAEGPGPARHARPARRAARGLDGWRRSGVVGYLLKDRVARVEEFLDALDRVAHGATVLGPLVIAQLLARQRRDNTLWALTARECQVLALLADGHSNTAIAQRLGSPRVRWKNTSAISSPSSAYRPTTRNTAVCSLSSPT
jgi:hypothetical protein